MKKNDIARAHAETSNWSITSNDGTNVVAKNIKSGVAYSGTTAAFNQMITIPVLMDEAAHFNPARNALVHPETGEDVVLGGAAASSPFLTVVSVPALKTVSNSDSAAELECANGANITIPTGLTLGFNLMFLMPATGNITVTPASGVTINGVTTPITISSTNFTAALLPTSVANVYKLTGV